MSFKCLHRKYLNFIFVPLAICFLLGIGGIELKLLEVQTGFAVLNEDGMGWAI